VYHVLNRGAKKGLLFADASDYRAFEELLGEAAKRIPIRILEKEHQLYPMAIQLLLNGGWRIEGRRLIPG